MLGLPMLPARTEDGFPVLFMTSRHLEKEDKMEGKAKFISPQIQDNPNGWGPCCVPTAFKDIPYQPFSKGDRIGKVSDWTGTIYQDRRYANKYQSQFGAGNQTFSYYHEEDETSFQLVDTSRPQRPAYLKNRNRMNQRGQRRDQRGMRGGNQNYGGNQGGMQSLSRGRDNRNKFQRKMQRNYGGGRWVDRKQGGLHKRVASVTVREEWKVLEEGELDFPRLSKLSLPSVGDPEDLYKCGTLQYYDKSMDRVTTKNELPLIGVDRIFHKVTTTDDPIISKLLSQGNVFATDSIMATLMTCTRSNYSWDIVVQRVGSKLFFDKRDDSEFDLLSVCETANDLQIDENSGINNPTNLSLEATFINQNFSQQVLKKKQLKFEHSNPFAIDEDINRVASVAYRYRKWDLGDGNTVIVRCEHDAVMHGPRGEESFLNIKTLNEFDSKITNVDWRQKLDSQRGAVLATELKNNSCKLAKWTVSSILAGSDYLKIGYVSRVNFLDSSKHVVLGTQQFRPKEFSTQIALNMDNAWGIFRCIVDICLKLPEGKYLILKDPNKGVVRIYDIPNSTFESSDEEGDDEEEEDDDDKDLGDD